MAYSSLINHLKAYSTFNPSHVQRFAGVGFEKAKEILAYLEENEAIIRDPSTKEWIVATSNGKLKQIYESHKSRLSDHKNLAIDHIDPMILMNASDDWDASSNRILIVGQETLGWDFKSGSYYPWPYPPIDSLRDVLVFSNSVTAMMHGYRVFEFSRHQSENFNSPFWRAYRQIRLAAGDDPVGFNTKVLYTNLFKTAVGGCSVVKNASIEESDNVWKISAELLTREIEVLKPDVVIFFTGPDYDRYLEKEFPDLKWEAVDNYEERKLSKLSHPALPEKSYRTYHPGYLSRGNWYVLDDICKLLIQGLF